MNKPKRKRSNKLLFLLTGLVIVLLVFALIGKNRAGSARPRKSRSSSAM
jgi:hypothetical protein